MGWVSLIVLLAWESTKVFLVIEKVCAGTEVPRSFVWMYVAEIQGYEESAKTT